MPIEKINPLDPRPEPINDSPELVEMTDDGGAVVDLEPDETREEEVRILASEHGANLAELLDDHFLDSLGANVCDAVTEDRESRSEWEDTIERGLKELGLKIEETSDPFPGACTATHPLLIENVVKFQSKAIHELFPAGGPVKTQIKGVKTPEKEQKASRVKEFMNYQVTEVMVEFFDESERMLFSLPLVGSAFKKCYMDASLGRPVSEFVPIDNFIVAYLSADLRRSQRFTHILNKLPEEVERDQEAGFYREIDLGQPIQVQPGKIGTEMDRIQGLTPTQSSQVHQIYEHHCLLKIPQLDPEGGMAKPYIVHVDSTSRKVLALYRNWRQGDLTFQPQAWFVHYKFVPGPGFYGLGLLHLIGSLAKSATSSMRALIDSGMFANLQGGFKAKGFRIVGGNDPIAPGEWRDVEAAGMDLSKAIVPLPFKEPSPTLFKLLEFVVLSGQKFADSTEQVISDSTNYGPVGTTLALLEASTRFFSAIHKRLHASLKQELRILKRINKDFLPKQYPYDVPGGQRNIYASDFSEEVDVIPVSDPNIPSQAHRLTRFTTLGQMAQGAPQYHNMREVYRQIYSAMEIDNIDVILPPPPQAQPQDPLSDIVSAGQGLPIKAFPGQDHLSHIAVKNAFINDPMNAQNQLMVPTIQALSANIKEHQVAFFVERAQALAQQAGQQMPPEQAQALAAQHVAKADAAQIMQAQQPQDPTVMLGMAELEQRSKEHEDDVQIEAARLAIKNRELNIREDAQIQKGFADGVKIKEKSRADLRKDAVKIAAENIKAVSKKATQRSSS